MVLQRNMSLRKKLFWNPVLRWLLFINLLCIFLKKTLRLSMLVLGLTTITLICESIRMSIYHSKGHEPATCPWNDWITHCSRAGEQSRGRPPTCQPGKKVTESPQKYKKVAQKIGKQSRRCLPICIQVASHPGDSTKYFPQVLFCIRLFASRLLGQSTILRREGRQTWSWWGGRSRLGGEKKQKYWVTLG